MIKYGQDFAAIHNECLEYIFQGLSIRTKLVDETNVDKVELIVSIANEYISNHCLTKETSQSLTADLYSSMTIEDIQNSLSPKEKKYIDRTLSIEPIYLNDLLDEIEKDTELPEINKQAVICFVTTYQASYQYWSENYPEWKENIDKPTTKGSSWTWTDIAIADAWWGYQGLVGSGLNPWVGGGLAAAGSAAAFLH